MTARQIIEEIKTLPPGEQAAVVSFAREWHENRKLSGEELESLGRRLAAATDPVEVAALTEAIIQGFAGAEEHA